MKKIFSRPIAVLTLFFAGAISLAGDLNGVSANMGSPPPAPEPVVRAPVETVGLGDAKKGRLQFFKCRSCHTLAPGGRHMVGPNLGNIFGAISGSKDAFGYSSAMREAGIEWTAQTLDAFIERPQDLVPGTTMAFVGIKNAQQRLDLLAYLKENTL